MGNELATQASAAVFVSLALQWIKKSSWFPLLTTETQKLNQWVSAAIAFASGFGIFLTWDHAGGVLTIKGLTFAHLLHAAGRGIQQWLMQHAAYKTIVAPPLPGETQQLQSQNIANGSIVAQASVK